MTISIRWQVDSAYVIVERVDDGPWNITVADAQSRWIRGAECVRALEKVLAEISSLRRHIWRNELKRQ